MNSSGEIHLRGAEAQQRTDFFNIIEPDICDFVLEEPCADEAPLHREMTTVKPGNRELRWKRLAAQVRIEIFIFRTEHLCGTPHRRSNFAPEGFLQKRNHLVSHAVAVMLAIAVRVIFSKGNGVCLNISENFAAPDVEQRAENRQRTVRGLALGARPHRPQARCTRSAKEMEQKRLDLIISVMGENKRGTSLLGRGLFKEGVALKAGCRFDGGALFQSTSGYVGTTCDVAELMVCGKLLDKPGVGRTGFPPKLMIEMANDQVAIAKIQQEMQQRDGVAPPRDTDQKALFRRLFPEKPPQRFIQFAARQSKAGAAPGS